MPIPSRRETLLLSVGASAVAALGLTMHLEHREMEAACEPNPIPDLAEETLVMTELDLPVVPDAEPFRAIPPPAPDAEPLAYGRAFSFVVRLDDRPHLVLSTSVEPAWKGEAPRVVAHGRVEADVAVDALPARLAQWWGRSVVLYGTHGAVGSGEVGAPKLIADVSGDLGVLLPDAEYDAYQEALDRGRPPPPLPADFVWDDGRQLLVAPIHSATQNTIVWARDAELPPPAVLVPTLERLRVGARARLLRHPEAAALTRRLRASVLEQSAPSPAADHVQLRTWRDIEGRVRAQTAWFESSELGSCGLEGAPVWSGVEVTTDGVRPLPWAPVEHEHVTGPVVVADLDVDGYLDVVLGADFWSDDTTLLAGGPEGWTTIETLPSAPFYGCPC